MTWDSSLEMSGSIFSDLSNFPFLVDYKLSGQSRFSWTIYKCMTSKFRHIASRPSLGKKDVPKMWMLWWTSHLMWLLIERALGQESTEGAFWNWYTVVLQKDIDTPHPITCQSTGRCAIGCISRKIPANFVFQLLFVISAVKLWNWKEEKTKKSLYQNDTWVWPSTDAVSYKFTRKKNNTASWS